MGLNESFLGVCFETKTGEAEEQLTEAQMVAGRLLTQVFQWSVTLFVTRLLDANDYGMMGTGRDGHSFIVVGPEGRIRWRADYGGAPNYTMYVPVPKLLADIRAGLKGGSS